MRTRGRKRGRSGGHKKGKIHHAWKPKAGAKFGLSQCDPYIRHTVYDTVVDVPRAHLCAKVFNLLRSKHVEILTRFQARDFLGDVRRYIAFARVRVVGGNHINQPPAALADEEAYLF